MVPRREKGREASAPWINYSPLQHRKNELFSEKQAPHPMNSALQSWWSYTKLNLVFERHLKPGGVCVWLGVPDLRVGGNSVAWLGKPPAHRPLGVGDKSSHPACLRATCTLQGETFCCQPEAQRGEVACLGPHSELVTMATCYLFVPCPAENGFRASPSPLPLRAPGGTSSSWEFPPATPALDHWLDTHRLIAL